MIQIILIKLNAVPQRENTNRLLSLPTLLCVSVVNLVVLAKCPTAQAFAQPDEPGLMFPAAVREDLSVLFLGGQGKPPRKQRNQSGTIHSASGKDTTGSFPL